jgi:hypothetical protein
MMKYTKHNATLNKDNISKKQTATLNNEEIKEIKT